ncbi:hypothetical protein FNYG_08741 [Fusarium nygamai]|uniref:Uncharacterized protein n=1 Tax=Gibberella nygamai TaxID=42673 RepID=A0A2K0W6V2_GIBNY|nr:hypothetical protein FNYG_08741 [Fusarium nygamai]
MRTKSRAECRRRKALRRAQGNEQQTTAAVSSSGNAENDAPTPSGVSSQSTSAQNESHTPRVDAPVQAEVTHHDNPQRGMSHDDSDLQDLRPIVQNYNLLRILPVVEISSDPTLLIQNPREGGPQSDICARVPGMFNHWAARVSCYDSFYDLWDLIVMHSGEEEPEVHLYLAKFGASYTYNRDLVAQELVLDEPASIVAWTNDPSPDIDFSQVTIVKTTTVSTTPLLPYLRHILGRKGPKWLV